MTDESRGQRGRPQERGQAAIETILLSFVLITFVAAMFQVYLVNQTVYRSLTAAHAALFSHAFERNKCDEESSECQYSSDPNAENLGGVAPRVIWGPAELPEVAIPVVGMFRRYGLGGDLRLWSSKRASDDDCPGRPCKRTKVGAGTYMGPIDGIIFLGRIDPGYISIDTGQLINSLGSLSGLF
jgi:hypothetical protein